MKPTDGDHALLIGMVAAALGELNRIVPTKVELLADKDGDYQNQIRLTRGSGTYLVTVDIEEHANPARRYHAGYARPPSPSDDG